MSIDGAVFQQCSGTGSQRRINASQHFRSFWRTIAGYEAISMIYKGQAYGSAAGAKIDLLHRGLFPATK